jgi:hypothetical protein
MFSSLMHSLPYPIMAILFRPVGFKLFGFPTFQLWQLHSSSGFSGVRVVQSVFWFDLCGQCFCHLSFGNVLFVILWIMASDKSVIHIIPGVASAILFRPVGFKLFGFPAFQLWAYLMKVIPETRRAH